VTESDDLVLDCRPQRADAYGLDLGHCFNQHPSMPDALRVAPG